MKRLILVLGLLTASGFAQFSLPPIRVQSSDPANCTTTGGIGELKIYYNTSTSSFKFCSAANTWSPFTSSPFASGGTTINVIPKSNGSGLFVDGSCTDNTNVTCTGVLIAADGGFAFSGDTAMKMARSANTVLFGKSDLAISTSSHYATLRSDGTLAWSVNTNPDTAGDLILGRRGAASLRFGAPDLNGTPVAQTIGFQNAITGSNLPGVQATIAGVLGTGTALPLPVVIQGADASVASGGTAQTEINRLVSADTKNLTSGAATTLLSIPLATLQTTGGLVFIHMEATDGTNQCTLDDLVTYAAENSAGVFVVNTSKMGTGANACTATKTLTATYGVTSANPALLQVTPTLGGITATRFTAVYTVMHGGMTNPTL